MIPATWISTAFCLGFTWAGSVSVMIKLANRIDADLGCRYASAQSVRGLDDLKTSTLYAVIGIRF